MSVNSDVVNQGIVLASILAGFAFVIAAEIALREPVPQTLRDVSLSFVVTGMLCLTAVAFGILYFAIENNQRGRDNVGYEFILFLSAAGLSFILALSNLFFKRFAKADKRYLVMFAGFLIGLIGVTMLLLRN